MREARLLRDLARYMHDPTEGGLAGGLLEVRDSCGLGIVLNENAIPLSPLTKRAAEKIGFDPLHLISSGVLLAALPPDKADIALRRLSGENIEAAVVGRFVVPRGKCKSDTHSDTHEELWRILNIPKR